MRYYHLRLRAADGMLLAFYVCSRIYVPLCLNCGLGVAPWFFTKAMAPVVGFLRRLGHRAFSYLDDFFGAAKARWPGKPTGVEDTADLGRVMGLLFDKLGLTLHSDKCFFEGTTRLEILGILVDTEEQQFLLSPKKLAAIKKSAMSTALRIAAPALREAEGGRAVRRAGERQRARSSRLPSAPKRALRRAGRVRAIIRRSVLCAQPARNARKNFACVEAAQPPPVARGHEGLSVVGAPRLQPARWKGNLACAGRVRVHGREHVRVGAA